LIHIDLRFVLAYQGRMTGNPSLADVRARRAEIAKTVEALQVEDGELAAAEGVLVRRFGTTPTAPAQVSGSNPDAEIFGKIEDETHEALKAEAESTAEDAAPVDATEDDPLIVQVKEAMKGNESIVERIVLLMENCVDDWWTATEIQNYLTKLRGGDLVPMGTVSPTLTFMKRQGTIVREGHKVGLASRFQTNEAAAE
jgi:hypothetical protein